MGTLALATAIVAVAVLEKGPQMLTIYHPRIIAAAVAAAALGALLPTAASAQQSPCYYYQHGDPRRIDCLRQEERNARQYQYDQEDIARDLEREHSNIGRDLSRAPLVGRYAGPAWDAPRQIDNGRREYEEYRRDRERRRRR